MKLRHKLLTAALLAFSVAGCQGQNEAYVNAENSAKEDAEKFGDVQNALSVASNVEVLATGTSGVPTFVRGQLGKVDQTVNGLALTSNAGLRASLERIAPMFRLSANDLVPTSTTRDELGFQHIRYAQTKNGLRVVNGELLVHIRNGQIYAANGQARDGISLSAVPTVTAQAALQAARNGSKDIFGAVAGNPQLTYLLIRGGTMALTWEVPVTGARKDTPARDLVYVNARTGQVVETHPLIHSALNRELHNLNHATTLPGPLARSEGGALNADAVVNSNYDLLGNVYTCYKTLFNRDSFDNLGGKLISSVHYSNNYVNAYWDSTQMVYGDGDGVQASNLALSLDVTAHELTHAVTERSANLTYSGESGGLNESMSDVLGNVCEAYTAVGASDAVPAGTWLVGETVWTPGTAGDALRYMNDPKKDGSSLDLYSQYNSTVDVHYSSGLGNLAFYLLSQGGTHPRGLTTNAVPAIGITKAAQIWYRALTTYMTASETFADARTHTKQAATDLYTATEVNAVDQAWIAVGVGVPVPPPTTTPLTNGVAKTGLSGATGAAQYFTLVVPAGQTTLTFTMSGGTGDADLYVKNGAAPTSTVYDCRPFTSGNAETCTFSSPAAGTWYVMINGYAAYSGVSLTGTYATTVDTTPALTNGVANTGLSGAASSQQFWKLTVPAGQAKVVFTITPGTGSTGDADLYVKRGAKPTTTTYDCRPFLSGNTETCTITSPVAGDYYVLLNGYTAYTNVTLKGQYP